MSLSQIKKWLLLPCLSCFSYLNKLWTRVYSAIAHLWGTLYTLHEYDLKFQYFATLYWADDCYNTARQLSYLEENYPSLISKELLTVLAHPPASCPDIIHFLKRFPHSNHLNSTMLLMVINAGNASALITDALRLALKQNHDVLTDDICGILDQYMNVPHYLLALKKFLAAPTHTQHASTLRNLLDKSSFDECEEGSKLRPFLPSGSKRRSSHFWAIPESKRSRFRS